jgi:peptidoglycan/xylan/chitin deacetylase (PgdA/CDA1 family)
MMARAAGMPPAVVHVDLDGAMDIFHVHGWPYRGGTDALFETGIQNLFSLLERNKIHATLFLIASSLEVPAKRRLVQEAIRRGHEIASHSVSHPVLTGLSRAEKQQQIEGSRKRIEAELGITVRGFRAPGYLMDRECFEFAAAAGYRYDSSVAPSEKWAQVLGVNTGELLAPHHPVAGSAMWELPLPDHRPSPIPFSPSYSLLIGTRYFRWGLERRRPAALPFIFLLHLTDVAAPLPPDPAIGFKQRFFTLSHISEKNKVARCERMLNLVQANYRMVTTEELLREVESGGHRTAE